MFESSADRGRETPVRVVVVDDHAILRSGVVRLLADAGSIAVVGEAEGVEPALGEIERGEPDVVLLDLDMPGVGGIEGCREILQRWPEMGIVILSMHDDPIMARRAFSAGARGYVVKTAADAELISAIAAVADGGRFVNATMGALLAAGSGESRIDVLTDREVDVLRLLALGHTNQEIAAELFLSARTVESHRAHIMRKLGVSTRAELVRVALENRLLNTTMAPKGR
ncbi:MAG TPA: response regulator transcription factor [Miltoncostaeales bacterium]|jgi:two-component system response regulator NreC|nr:response regulator transcription factor [Miltoncostaeales bacterium]